MTVCSVPRTVFSADVTLMLPLLNISTLNTTSSTFGFADYSHCESFSFSFYITILFRLSSRSSVYLMFLGLLASSRSFFNKNSYGGESPDFGTDS